MTKFLLDSGDPNEYKQVSDLAKAKGQELWGSTTNPSLIAKKLAGQKLSPQDAFKLQKDLVMEILDIVPGAVSAEVYADAHTTAQEMAEQGKDISSWHKRVVVKLPTTLEGLKARTILRNDGITINNTLVFSQQQVFAISLHEKLIKEKVGPAKYPCFISPFVGRLDDKGQNGLSMLKHSIELVRSYFESDLVWMLEASVRNVEQVKGGLDYGSELETIRTSVFIDWLNLSQDQQHHIDYAMPNLSEIPVWTPTPDLLAINSVDGLMEAMVSGKLDITHELTTAGIEKFVEDWKAILA